MTWLPGMKRVPNDAENRDGAGPWKYLDSGALHPYSGHGRAVITHKDGWTALGIVDISVDKRPGSHSTFAIEGTYLFNEALAIAAKAFPQIITRIGKIYDVTDQYTLDRQGRRLRHND